MSVLIKLWSIEQKIIQKGRSKKLNLEIKDLMAQEAWKRRLIRQSAIKQKANHVVNHSLMQYESLEK